MYIVVERNNSERSIVPDCSFNVQSFTTINDLCNNVRLIFVFLLVIELLFLGHIQIYYIYFMARKYFGNLVILYFMVYVHLFFFCLDLSSRSLYINVDYDVVDVVFLFWILRNFFLHNFMAPVFPQNYSLWKL